MIAWLRIIFVGILILPIVALIHKPNVVVTVNQTSGSYTISVQGHVMFTSGALRVRNQGKMFCGIITDKCQGLLIPKMGHPTKGFDSWGWFTAQHVFWSEESSLSSVPLLQTSFLTYDDGFVVLEATFLRGLTNSSGGGLGTNFPSFTNNSHKETLNWLTWNQAHEFSYGFGAGGLVDMCKNDNCFLPVVLYGKMSNKNKYSIPSVVISPTNTFKDIGVGLSHLGEWVTGLKGTIESVPPGFTMGFMIVAEEEGSPRKVLDTWGALLRKRYHRSLHTTDKSVASAYLGYWTDNGAQYYYHTENGSSYEDTMQMLYSYHKHEGLDKIFGYYQLDSWFYPKGSESDPPSCSIKYPKSEGFVEWDACAELLPSGMPHLVSDIIKARAMAAHSRWISPISRYLKDMPEYQWIIDHKHQAAIPVDTRGFFRALISDAKRRWGLSVYEQDWLDAIFGKNIWLGQGAGRTSRFLIEMGQGVADAGLTVGYGSADPYDILQALEIPAATFVFASENPYSDVSTEQNYHISRTALLTYQVGMVAMKDTWWSTHQADYKTHGNPKYDYKYGGFVNCEMHAAIATLSNAPVAPSDAIGRSNKTLLLRTCRADGLLLRPDRPCLAMDSSLIPGFKGELCDAVTNFGRGGQYHYVLAAALAKEIQLKITDLDISKYTRAHGQAFAMNISNLDFFVTDAASVGTITSGILNEQTPLTIPADLNASFIGGHHAWHLLRISPALEVSIGDDWNLKSSESGKWFFLGEPSKFVSVSRQRFTSIGLVFDLVDTNNAHTSTNESSTTSISHQLQDAQLQVQLVGVIGEHITVQAVYITKTGEITHLEANCLIGVSGIGTFTCSCATHISSSTGMPKTNGCSCNCIS